MVSVYVEARPKGRPDNHPVENYVVEDQADHILAAFAARGDRVARCWRPPGTLAGPSQLFGYPVIAQFGRGNWKWSARGRWV
jgi:hypothetical protein